MTKQENDDFFYQVYDKFKATVYKYIYISLDFNANLADDCIQDVFEAAYGKVEALIHHPNPDGFLIVTARNYIKKYKDYLIKQSKRTVALDTYETSLCYQQDFEEGINDSLDLEYLKQLFLSMISEQELGLYKMFYDEQLPVSKISKDLCITENNVKVRLYRLRLKIKEMIKAEFDKEGFYESKRL